MKVSPVWYNLLGSVVRWALVFALAPLAARGIITPEEMDATIIGAVPDIVAWIIVLGALVWSFVQKWRADREVEVALKLPADSSREKLDHVIAIGD